MQHAANSATCNVHACVAQATTPQPAARGLQELGYSNLTQHILVISEIALCHSLCWIFDALCAAYKA